MQLFYVNPDAPEILPVEEAVHCIKVLRHKVGDIIYCIDGKGNFFESQIARISKRTVELQVLRKETKWGEHSYQIHLFFSPLKSKDRLEWLIEKSVELGVTELHPLITHRTEKQNISQSRLSLIMVAAIKQAKRSFLPVLHPPLKLNDNFLLPKIERGFIAHCNASNFIAPFLEKNTNIQSWGFAIGPEGDFSSQEVLWFQQKGFQEISLGTNRLRSETAAIFVLSALKNSLGY
ncbi:MAG: RsmE family RNA methyltransferase [Bacteroidia bacterium]|nr:16S rRNA (uracil(1498)-N(3))-methyltransferase [Bacteroidia bacterium]MDW8159527.1 RsmE family RNA methyltransferase [Bacteroidia bacterium]